MWRSTLRTSLRVLLPQSRQYARKAALSASLRKQIVFETPFSILDTYRKHCSHPDLSLLRVLSANASPSQSSPRALETSVATSSLEEAWTSIAYASTLASSLDSINSLLARHASSYTSTPPVLPSWVVLSVLLKEPITQYEAFAAHSIALSHLSRNASELGPLLILLSAHWLAKYRMFAPLHSMVLRTLQLKSSIHAYQISLFLRILGHADPCREVQKLMAILIDVATNREFDLGVRTYRILLENPSATSGVARLVERHMHSRGYVPNLSHTRAFVRIYGRTGRRTRAARYWWRIRAGEYHGPNAEYATQRKQQSRMLEDYLRSFKSPKKMNLYIKYLLKSTSRTSAQAKPENADGPHVFPPTLPRPDGISHRVWLQALRTTSEHSSIPAEDLLVQFNAGKDHIGSPQKTLVAYFLVIKGLVRRAKYTEAVQLLEDVMPMKTRFDGPKLTMAVEALTMAHKPDAAFLLLLEFVHKQTEPPFIRPTCSATAVEHAEDAAAAAWTSLVYAPKGQLVDVRAINSFMICLLRISRPDAVFYLWDTMPRIFGIEPNSTTFSILLKTARFARKYEGALQVAIADFGMGRILPTSGKGTEAELHPQRLGRDEAITGIETLLAPSERRRVTGFWRGERAGDVALRVAWQLLVGNFPILAQFTAPFQAIRRSADQPGYSPITDLIHSFGGRAVERQSAFASKDNDDGVGSTAVRQGHEASRPYDAEGRTFFNIVPDDAGFRALIDLLATEDRAHQVALVLVWMRYLRVFPSRDTLATALVYWGEVALEGPWVERVREWRARARGAEESQYMRMVKWITKWVGKKNIPGKDEMHRALRRVRWFRESLEGDPRSSDGQCE